MAVLNKLHYWEFPCGVTSFFGKYPLSGQFWTAYSHTPFTLTFLPLAVIWAMSPRKGHVHSPTVWERRKGSAFLSEWMQTCKRETQKSSYWKWMMSRGWSVVSPFPQKGGPSFQTVERASGLRWGQELRLLLFPSVFQPSPILNSKVRRITAKELLTSATGHLAQSSLGMSLFLILSPSRHKQPGWLKVEGLSLFIAVTQRHKPELEEPSFWLSMSGSWLSYKSSIS